MTKPITVTFDGQCYRAHKRGGAGFVFGDTAAEAASRAATLQGNHPRKIVEAPGKRKKRGHKQK